MSGTLAPLQKVTRNLPGLIRNPLVGLIGTECYTSLIWNIDLSDTECIKYSVSKGLGLGLVAGGGIVKIPQIIKLLTSHSAQGLSLVSYLLDTASLLITVAYNARLQFPFSTYGENAFLTIQNVLIVCLIITFSRTSSKAAKAVLFLISVASAVYLLCSSTLVPISVLRILLAFSIPLSLASKIPQIAKIQSNGSTGQLSAFLVFNSLAGTLARVFTTATETGDRTLWWSFFSASALNAVLAAQMCYYWNDTKKDPQVKSLVEDEKEHRGNGKEKDPSAASVINPANVNPAKSMISPTRSTKPATRSTSSRYTRKVD